MLLAGNSERNGRISALLTDVADGVGRLVGEHLALARAELGRELGGLSKSAARVVAFGSLALVGYGFLCAALVAYFASLGMSWALALLLVGAANVVIGASGAYPALRRISARPLLHAALDELDRSAAALLPAAAEKVQVPNDKRV